MESLPLPHYNTWQLIKAYWQSSSKRMATLFFAGMIMMTIMLVGMEVLFNYWYNFFYDALQAYDVHKTVRLLIIFCILAAFNIIIAVYRYYISQLFGLRWRRWLTTQFVTRWLEKKGYYYLENFDKRTDNPDQRIQEDVGTLIANFIDLSLGLVSAITTIFAFIYILWTLSGIITFTLGSHTFHISGYLVWVGLIYSSIGTWLTFKIGRPLVHLNFEQQRREATFRYAAIDLRSHAEHVALYRGEAQQKSILDRLFSRVLENWYFIILRQKLLLWFTAGYGQAAVFLPLLVALPNYFGKVFLLGGLIQSLNAFTHVQDSLSFIVNSYTQIAQWQAICQRLTTFINHLNSIERAEEKRSHITYHHHVDNTIVTKALSLQRPDNAPLLDKVNTKFTHGHDYLLKGPSGIGKTSFVRALAGIWPYAAGDITFPAHKKIMYLPQKPYMPLGTLAEAILFPKMDNHEMEEHLPEILEVCRLPHLIPVLYESANWGERLSPGEQQRIAFARVFLEQPDWVFLDESTSMLDIENEKYFYHLLKTHLSGCSIVSVGHRPTLDAYHSEVIDMTKYVVTASIQK